MAMTLIQSQADFTNQTTVTFNSGIDSTYKLYIFKFLNISPATDNAHFQFKTNPTDGADYDDQYITSTFFQAWHNEADDDTTLAYNTSYDLENVTAYPTLAESMANGADESGSGTLRLFHPSGTTYAKLFNSEFQAYSYGGDFTVQCFGQGYILDATAIDDIKFTMNTGNFDGTIKMYGVK
tara:strand:- start:515 stop:1057 length:543 start_codon:yes stop_codon:yes gene_type:complete